LLLDEDNGRAVDDNALKAVYERSAGVNTIEQLDEKRGLQLGQGRR
jgi:hypothetical protein